MGRLTAGMLVALAMLFGAVASAQAAEIPPTGECVSLDRKLTKAYESESRDATRKELKELDRKFIEDLVEAGCLSDAEPLLKEMPLEPFSEQCAQGAKGAERFWKPRQRSLVAMMNKLERRSEPIQARQERAVNRLNRLKLVGASNKRIRSARRAVRVTTRKLNRVTTAQTKRMVKMLRPQLAPTELIVGELMSRRCLHGDFLFERKPKGPAAKVTQRYGLLIFITFFINLMPDEPVAITTSAATAEPVAPSTIEPDADRFALPSYLTPGG